MKKLLATCTTAFLAAASLSGCSLAQEYIELKQLEREVAREIAESEREIEEAQREIDRINEVGYEAFQREEMNARGEYDTGWYPTEPDGLKNPPGGIVKLQEVAGYGAYVVMPYQLRPQMEFSEGGGHAGMYEDINWLTRTEFEALEPVRNDFYGSFGVMSVDAANDNRAVHGVMRFNNPDAARRAAELINEAYLREGHYQLTDFGEQITIDGHPDVLATKNGPQIVGVLPQEEFLVFVSVENRIDFENRILLDMAGYEWSDDSWQPGYVKAFFDQQPEMPKVAETTKTRDGYGKNPDLPQYNPYGSVSYVLTAPRDARGFIEPISMSANAAKPGFHDIARWSRLLDETNVQEVVRSDANLLRFENAKSAQAFVPKWKQLHIDAAGADQVTDFADPQNVPGSECVMVGGGEEPGPLQTCAIQYGRYVAVVEKQQYVPLEELTGYDTGITEEVAAQYVRMTHMPKKQSGVRR